MKKGYYDENNEDVLEMIIDLKEEWRKNVSNKKRNICSKYWWRIMVF